MSNNPSFSSRDTDGISVTEFDERTGVPSGALFAGLLEAYQGQGYERGYKRATADILSSLLLLTEEYLRSRDDAGPQLRKTLYDFEAYLEQFLHRPADGGFVSDGLGI